MTAPTAATLPVIKALLDEAARKRFTGGVLGVRAKPEWTDAAEFEHNGLGVRVVVCPSALAVREALVDRAQDRWLVVLTDRDEKELGLGITAHLTWQRLRRPDPWAAVEDKFGATRVDHRLVSGAHARDLATGLLAATPPDGWPPARAGLLTGDHAFGAVASHRLGLGQVGEQWTSPPCCAGRRVPTPPPSSRTCGPSPVIPLVEALLAWVTERCGSCGRALGPLLREGRAGDAVPLGLVARVVTAAVPDSGPRALLGREIGGQLADQSLTAWAGEAESVAGDLVADGSGCRRPGARPRRDAAGPCRGRLPGRPLDRTAAGTDVPTGRAGRIVAPLYRTCRGPGGQRRCGRAAG